MVRSVAEHVLNTNNIGLLIEPKRRIFWQYLQDGFFLSICARTAGYKTHFVKSGPVFIFVSAN